MAFSAHSVAAPLRSNQPRKVPVHAISVVVRRLRPRVPHPAVFRVRVFATSCAERHSARSAGLLFSCVPLCGTRRHGAGSTWSPQESKVEESPCLFLAPPRTPVPHPAVSACRFPPSGAGFRPRVPHPAVFRVRVSAASCAQRHSERSAGLPFPASRSAGAAPRARAPLGARRKQSRRISLPFLGSAPYPSAPPPGAAPCGFQGAGFHHLMRRASF